MNVMRVYGMQLSATMAPTVTVATVPSTVPSSSSSSSPSLPGKTERAGVLFVEDIERRQTDVSNFLLSKSNSLTHFGVQRWHIRC